MALFLLADLLFVVLDGAIIPWSRSAVDISNIAGCALCARACAMQGEMMR